MMKMKFNLIIALLFVSIASVAQSKKLVKSFKLGAVGYSLYETSKPSKAKNDTVFYSLYRVGKPIVIAKEIKSVVSKTDRDTLDYSVYKINRDAIGFYYNNNTSLHLYSQNKNGLLNFKSRALPPEVSSMGSQYVVAPPTAAKPNDYDTSHPSVVDIPAEFPGGMNAFRRYIANNLQYPEEAQENSVQGSVIVKFIIEKDGALTNIQIEKKLGYGCDEEVIRVIKKSPNWNPAKLNGQQVRFSFRMPVSFSLGE